MREPLIHGESLIGSREELTNSSAHNMRQSLTAKLFGHVERRPAPLTHLVECRLETSWRPHDPVFNLAAFPITNGIQWRQNFRANLASLFQHGTSEVSLKVRIAGDAGGSHFENFVQDKLRVFHWGGVAGHNSLPKDQCGVVGLFGGGTGLFHRGDHALAPFHLLSEIGNRGVQFLALPHQLIHPLLRDLICLFQLGHLLATAFVKLQ